MSANEAGALAQVYQFLLELQKDKAAGQSLATAPAASTVTPTEK